MLRKLVLGAVTIAALAFSTTAFAQGQFGTAAEAKAMLEKAVAAVKADKAKALDQMQKGEGGFKDRDLYAFCANASDGIITAHPALKGKNIREIKELTPHLAEKPATARNSKDIHGLIDVRRITMVKNDLAALNREVN